MATTPLKHQNHRLKNKLRQDALVVWENRSVAHAGPVDGLMFEEERIVYSIAVVGDLPYGPDDFVSRALKGDLFEAMV